MNKFILKSEYQPTGDQPQAIEKLVNGLKEGKKFQSLLGVTGSGKTEIYIHLAAEALAQIKDKGYAKPYAADSRKVFRVGISFSSATGTVEDWSVE